MDEIIVTARIRKDGRDAKPYLCVEVKIGNYLLVNYEQGDLGVDLVEASQDVNH